MPPVYSIITPVQLATIDWGDLTGKEDYVVKVLSGAMTIAPNRTRWNLTAGQAYLSLWLDFGDTSSVPYSGGVATALTDKSSNANTITYFTNIVKSSTTQNSRYFAVLNNTSASYFSTSTAINPSSGQSYMIFMLFKQLYTSTQSIITQYGGDLTFDHHVFDDHGMVYMAGAQRSVGTWTSASLYNYSLYCCTYDSTTSTTTIYLNGASKGSYVGATTWTNSGSMWCLNGTYPNSGGAKEYGIRGNLYEFVMIKGSADVALKYKIEGYIMDKWGLSTYLDSGHPFYGTYAYT